MSSPREFPDSENGPSGKFACSDPVMFCSAPWHAGYSGDDIPANEIRMAQPFGRSAVPAGRILFNKAGELLFADTSKHLIRKIGRDGMVRRVAGTPPEGGVLQNGYAGDGGPALAAKLSFPVDLAFADDGTLFFTDILSHRALDRPKGQHPHRGHGKCGEKGYAWATSGPPRPRAWAFCLLTSSGMTACC